ncbi:CGNR zinc finger domain-containing protein [Streptomyces sp. NPDC002851]
MARRCHGWTARPRAVLAVLGPTAQLGWGFGWLGDCAGVLDTWLTSLVWPTFIAALLFRFRAPLNRLIETVNSRVEQGDPLDLAGIALGPSSPSTPSGPEPRPGGGRVGTEWCGMEGCGNRVKAAAYRARRQAAKQGREPSQSQD